MGVCVRGAKKKKRGAQRKRGAGRREIPKDSVGAVQFGPSLLQRLPVHGNSHARDTGCAPPVRAHKPHRFVLDGLQPRRLGLIPIVGVPHGGAVFHYGANKGGVGLRLGLSRASGECSLQKLPGAISFLTDRVYVGVEI